MLIQSYVVSEEVAAESGLKATSMQGLRRYVAIAGKNGAGKSRLLKLLEREIRQRGEKSLAEVEDDISANENALKSQPESTYAHYWRDALNEALARQSRYQRLVTDKNQAVRVIRFVPKELELQDPNNKAPSQLAELFSQAATADVESYAHVCLAYIQKLQNRRWEATHKDFQGTPAEQLEICDSYDSLVQVIQTFLGVTLTRNANSEAILFGKPLALANLSDGQKVILQLATVFHAQQARLNNTVFLLDELENHLHPAACIDVLKTLEQAAPQAQVWVATHSVPLLAYISNVEPNSIWFMVEGVLKNAGRHPEWVLEGLLGNEEGVSHLHNFTGLPAQLAANTFAAESLMPPRVVTTGAKDPQLMQISGLLQKRMESGPLTLLDFGAGKGRLLGGLESVCEGKRVGELFSYIAFDQPNDDKEQCCTVIAHHYGSSVGRYFDSDSGYFSEKSDGSVDVAVMCNVLHEIPPQEWIRIFSAHSLIGRALKDDGFLLVVEDQRIPVGEKAHEYGFLVFDTPQFRTLFKVTEQDQKNGLFAFDDHRGDGRLKAHWIEKSLLKRVTAESRDLAIEQLRAEASNQVRLVRKLPADYKTGLAHGFWTQQFANAAMYLEEQGIK